MLPLTTVTGLSRRSDGSWTVRTERTGSWLDKRRRVLRAGQVVLAAGTWGTQNLLHSMRDSGELAEISPKLGELTRTNSEAILGATRGEVDAERDFTEGVAITSSFHPDDRTHIEPVCYGKGSNGMGLLQTLATDGDSPTPRWRQLISAVAKRPVWTLRTLSVRRWSQRTVILLVMQALDNSITTRTRRGLLGRRRLTSVQNADAPNPTWIPKGSEAAERVAGHIDGTAGGTWTEIFDIPLTAHFIGGCVISTDAEHGVIDPYHRVHNYPTLSVVDGSAITANLGVNPSLTITAQAERAFSMWPNKGEVDARPEQGGDYRRVAPVAPARPVVPEAAPAALRLPIVEIRTRGA